MFFKNTIQEGASFKGGHYLRKYVTYLKKSMNKLKMTPKLQMQFQFVTQNKKWVNLIDETCLRLKN